MSPRREPVPEAELHLESAPATPAQWEAWRWLWRRLLANTLPPTEDQAGPDADPEEAPCADHADHQGRAGGAERTV